MIQPRMVLISSILSSAWNFFREIKSHLGVVSDGKEVPAAEMGVDEEGNEQRPVRTVQEAPAEDLATYGGRK